LEAALFSGDTVGPAPVSIGGDGAVTVGMAAGEAVHLTFSVEIGMVGLAFGIAAGTTLSVHLQGVAAGVAFALAVTGEDADQVPVGVVAGGAVNVTVDVTIAVPGDDAIEPTVGPVRRINDGDTVDDDLPKHPERSLPTDRKDGAVQNKAKSTIEVANSSSLRRDFLRFTLACHFRTLLSVDLYGRSGTSHRQHPPTLVEYGVKAAVEVTNLETLRSHEDVTSTVSKPLSAGKDALDSHRT